MGNRFRQSVKVSFVTVLVNFQILTAFASSDDCAKTVAKVIQMPERVLHSYHNHAIVRAMREERLQHVEAFLRDEVIYPNDKFRTHKPLFIDFFGNELGKLAVIIDGKTEILSGLEWAGLANQLIVEAYISNYAVSNLVRNNLRIYAKFDDTLYEIFRMILAGRQYQKLLSQIKVFAIYQSLNLAVGQLVRAFPFITIERKYLVDWANVIALEVNGPSTIGQHSFFRGVDQIINGRGQVKKNHLIAIDKIDRLVEPLFQRPPKPGILGVLNDFIRQKIIRMGHNTLHPAYEGQTREWRAVPAVGDVPPLM